MTAPKESTSAPKPEAKPSKVAGDVRIETGDFVLTMQHEDEAREKFAAEHEGRTLSNVRVVTVSHDIGHGATYSFEADAK